MTDIKFGTDGWRAITAWDFTFENVKRTAQATADFIRLQTLSREDLQKYNVIVGYDGRFLSREFARAFAEALCSNNIKTALCSKPTATTVISYLTVKKFRLGIVITASHNPWNYNGIKIKYGGASAPAAITDAIEENLDKRPPIINPAVKIDTADFSGDYVKFIGSKFRIENLRRNIKNAVVIDFMNGVSAELFRAVSPVKKAVFLNEAPSPIFGYSRPEPIEELMKNLSAQVVKNKAVLGIAFDGDGDRAGFTDEKGKYINPSQVSAVLLDYLVRVKKAKGTVVQTVSMGYLSKQIARQNNFQFEETPVGFKNVSEKMAKGGVVFGGEESGGYVWDGFIDRDGLLAALLFLEIISTAGKSVSQLVKDVEAKYGKSVFERKDFRLSKPVADKKVFAQKLAKKLPKRIGAAAVSGFIDIDGLKIVMADDSWVLARPSGTEPLLRIYAESKNAEQTSSLIAFMNKLAGGLVKLSAENN